MLFFKFLATTKSNWLRICTDFEKNPVGRKKKKKKETNSLKVVFSFICSTDFFKIKF